MALVASLSKYKIKTFKLWIGVCVLAALVLAYDGYLSKYQWSKRYEFYKHHVIDKGGKPDVDMVLNQNAPFVLIGLAALMGGYLFIIRNKKVVADETGLVVDEKINIAYNSILKIDKTLFDSKGRFTITYRGPDGKETDLTISDKNYDGLGAILDQAVAKIS